MAYRSAFGTPVVVQGKRRGFGLFNDDDDEGDRMEENILRSLSANRPGAGMFTNGADEMLPSPSSAASSPTKSSRKSSLVKTPQRPRPSHRSNPYSTTTSRALQRAKKTKEAPIESQLISSAAVYETTPVVQTKAKYTMHGAKESLNTNVEEDDTEEEHEGGKERGDNAALPVTPSRNIFSRTAPGETPATPSSAERQLPDTGKKTWSQWLSKILPASVKKPVSAILGAPSDTASPGRVRTPTHAARSDEGNHDEDRYMLPGSFDRRPRSLSPTMSQGPMERQNTVSFEISYESPCRKAFSFDASYGTQFRSGSFDLGKSQSSSFPRALPAPSKRDAPEKAPSKRPPRPSATPAIEPGSIFHKPSNFIERMRTAKSNHRYDPYSRPTSRLPRGNLPRTESEGTLTAEQELEILIQRERDRKVQEAEDRYLKREIKRKLGQLDDEGDEEMSSEDESPTDPKPTVEDAPDHEDERVEEQVETPAPPPKSPVKQKRRDSVAPSPSPAGPLPNFLFGETPVPAPAALSPPSPIREGLEITAGGAPPPTSWSFSSDSDKENISSGPPPPPTMSHAQLPAPLTTSSQPPAVAGGLFSKAPQPAGGFGLGLPKESPAVGRQRSQAEKFKPVNPSGLRESSTVDEEKENEMDLDIENQNPSSADKKKSGEKSTTTTTSAQQLQQSQGSQNAFRPSLALKENAGVLNLGKNSEGKVDIRAKIEALSNKQLECAITWPAMATFGDGDVRSAVESMFNSCSNPKEYPPGITSDMFGLAVKVDF